MADRRRADDAGVRREARRTSTRDRAGRPRRGTKSRPTRPVRSGGRAAGRFDERAIRSDRARRRGPGPASTSAGRGAVIMLPGVDGHLVSCTLVERRVSSSIDTLTPERARRQLIAWRERSRAFGPATSLRALLQQGAAPLTSALGFDSPTALEVADPVLAATLVAGGRPVAFLVAPWAEPLDPLWRLAVTQALHRASDWCLLFDGLHLRIVDAGRLYARRYLQFDLDLAIDHPRAFAALWCAARAGSLTADAADTDSLHALVAASDRHAPAVCRSLRNGVLAASSDVLQALIGRRPAARLP